MPKGALKSAERSQLIDYYAHCREMGNDWLRTQIIEHNRIDILAQAILGYQVEPFHLALLLYQFHHPDNLQLVFRGAGKTTMLNILSGFIPASQRIVTIEDSAELQLEKSPNGIIARSKCCRGSPPPKKRPSRALAWKARLFRSTTM